MKVKMLAATTTLMVGIVGSSAAMAVPSLGDIAGNANLNPVRDTGAESVSLTDFNSNTDTSTTGLILKSEGLASGFEFGIYSFSNVDGIVTETDRLKLFDAADSAFPYETTRTVTFDLDGGTATANHMTASIGAIFGFYLKRVASEFTWFSHTSLNSDANDHALIFHPLAHGLQDELPIRGANVAVAFDAFCGEKCGPGENYDDVLVGLNDVVPVPEPGTLALLGLGLLGLGAARRHKA